MTNIHKVPEHLPPLPDGAVYLGLGPLCLPGYIIPFGGYITNPQGRGQWVWGSSRGGGIYAGFAAPLDSHVTRHILAHRVPDGVPVLPEGAVYAGKGFNIPREIIGSPCWVYDFVVRDQWVEGTCHGAPDFDYAFPLDSPLARKLLGLERDTRPSWEDAPDWAEWLAQDADGEWWWYQNEPQTLTDSWDEAVAGNAKIAAECERNPEWCTTLERRPDSQLSDIQRGMDEALDRVEKSKAAESAVEATASPGVGSLTLNVDVGKLNEIVEDAIREVRKKGGPPDLCIPRDVSDEMFMSDLTTMREKGYRITIDDDGIKGWKDG